MKTFSDLVKEVQDTGLCHHCGGCVTFCTAINFGALKQDADGKPCYDDVEKCIECGICYMICPEIDELRDETLKRIGWVPPWAASWKPLSPGPETKRSGRMPQTAGW